MGYSAYNGSRHVTRKRVVRTEGQHPYREERDHRGDSKDHNRPPGLPVKAVDRSLIERCPLQGRKLSKLQDLFYGEVIDDRRCHGS